MLYFFLEYYNWEEWQDCTQDCGGGARQRIRNCVWGSNADCEDAGGTNFESEECNMAACPSN